MEEEACGMACAAVSAARTDRVWGEISSLEGPRAIDFWIGVESAGKGPDKRGLLGAAGTIVVLGL